MENPILIRNSLHLKYTPKPGVKEHRTTQAKLARALAIQLGLKRVIRCTDEITGEVWEFDHSNGRAYKNQENHAYARIQKIMKSIQGEPGRGFQYFQQIRIPMKVISPTGVVLEDFEAVLKPLTKRMSTKMANYYVSHMHPDHGFN